VHEWCVRVCCASGVRSPPRATGRMCMYASACMCVRVCVCLRARMISSSRDSPCVEVDKGWCVRRHRVRYVIEFTVMFPSTQIQKYITGTPINQCPRPETCEIPVSSEFFFVEATVSIDN
jgi:hypothetical protein